MSALLVSNHLEECSAALLMTLAAMQRMKMPIWNFQRHLAGLSLYPAPPTAAEITVAESSAQRFVFDRRMSEMGQTRHFERGPMTSGLPR